MNAWLRHEFECHGLQKVPDFMRRECACQICGDNFPNTGSLWTQETLREPTDAKGYRAWFERIRLNSYCTFHAGKYVAGLGEKR